MEHWFLEHKLLVCRPDHEALDGIGHSGLSRKRIFERNREGAEMTQIAFRY
jgi:hypothetical protein